MGNKNIRKEQKKPKKSTNTKNTSTGVSIVRDTVVVKDTETPKK